jgi:hypothetical protein
MNPFPSSFSKVLLFSLLVPAAADDLPQLVERPWIGCYAGYERRNFHFSVGSEGVGLLVPMGDRDSLMSSRYAIRILPVVEEVAADGKVTGRTPKKGGWEAVTPAAADPEKVVYRGTTAGDARFEVTMEFDGDLIRFGGKLLENGTLKQPRFVLRVQVPDVYSADRNIERREEKAKKDRLELVRTDGKKLRLDVLTAIDAESAEFSGPGVAQARIDFAGYKGHRFELAAGDAGTFEFWNRGMEPLIEGFTLGWKPDPAKDPDGKARATLRVR